ncbi:hypothetical protein Hanom_Chr02g00117401 [Helianthus anomalus]
MFSINCGNKYSVESKFKIKTSALGNSIFGQSISLISPTYNLKFMIYITQNS